MATSVSPAARELQLYAIAPTLFDSGLGVDAKAMAAAAEVMIGQGINRFLLTGSYGEFQSLTDDERVEIARALRAVEGADSLMCCAVATSTDATSRLAERLVDAGADLVMVAAPLACEVTTSEVIRHFEVLADRLQDGIVVYNNPVFGRDLTADELAQITAFDAIAAVKQGTKSLPGFVESLAAVRQASGDRARVLAASDVTGALALFAGADGLTSTNSWVFPGPIARIVELSRIGEFAAAAAIANALDPYFATVRYLGQPRAVKAAMQLRGLPGSDEVRSPYRRLSETERDELHLALDTCDASLAGLGFGGAAGFGGLR